MVFAKIGDPIHLHCFPHMDVVTFEFLFICIIKLRILWNTTTMTQHWNIRRLEVLCLPTKLVHILYCCYVFSLIHHSLQISTKIRYIRIKESVHSIISRFFKLKEPSTSYLLVHVINFFLCLILAVRSWTVSSIYAPLKNCCVGTETIFWVIQWYILDKNPFLFPWICPFYFQIFTILFLTVRN